MSERLGTRHSECWLQPAIAGAAGAASASDGGCAATQTAGALPAAHFRGKKQIQFGEIAIQ